MQITPLLSVVSILAWPAMAFGLSNPCDRAALLSAGEFGIPPQVMLAIARVESGRAQEAGVAPWPWTVNAGGQSHRFESQAEAVDFVNSRIEEGQSNLDLGCFQLNWHWHGEHFASVAEMFSQTENADYAARFLVENYRKRGNWVDAVASYHSETPHLAEIYIEKVEEVLISLSSGEASADDAVTVEVEPVHDNRFPLLQPGSNGSLASLVQSRGIGAPLIVARP